MAKVFTFSPADDSLIVFDAAAGVRWSMTAEQAVKHDAMFRAEMSVAERAKIDAIKTDLADAPAPK